MGRNHDIETAKENRSNRYLHKENPIKRAIRRAHKNHPRYKLDCLLKEESRWQRKQTIAINKLAGVRRKINKLINENIKSEI